MLNAVAELGPVSQADLGRTLRVDPKDMAAIAGDLHRDGLVDRAPDPADRRRNAVTISARGREILARTERLGEAANAELTTALTPAEREQLLALLARIVSPAEGRVRG